jgi:hypothetical protein
MACAGASGAPQSLSVNAGDSVTIIWDGATGELLGQGGRTDSKHPPWVHACVISPVHIHYSQHIY